ncbi:MAG: hypothetical protein NTY12_04350 [Candidatus Falkowbacteria bacterium]|nr:hypothetical protein [Candidatus Falkowbacteria bacterium]
MLLVLLSGCSLEQKSIDYNEGSKNYPGVKEGEVFLRIISTEFLPDVAYCPNSSGLLMFSMVYSEDALFYNFCKIDYTTKRVGDVAYMSSGKIVPNHVPVFVSAVEWEMKQKEFIEWKKSMGFE